MLNGKSNDDLRRANALGGDACLIKLVKGCGNESRHIRTGRPSNMLKR